MKKGRLRKNYIRDINLNNLIMGETYYIVLYYK